MEEEAAAVVDVEAAVVVVTEITTSQVHRLHQHRRGSPLRCSRWTTYELAIEVVRRHARIEH